MAGNEHGVLRGDAAGRVGRADFAHGHADHAGRAHAEGGEQVRQRNLDGGNRHLRGFGVVGLGVIVDELQNGPAGFALDKGVEFHQTFFKKRRHLNHVLGHLAVLGAEAGVHEDRAMHRRGIRRGDAYGDGSFRHLAEALDGFLA